MDFVTIRDLPQNDQWQKLKQLLYFLVKDLKGDLELVPLIYNWFRYGVIYDQETQAQINYLIDRFPRDLSQIKIKDLEPQSRQTNSQISKLVTIGDLGIRELEEKELNDRLEQLRIIKNPENAKIKSKKVPEVTKQEEQSESSEPETSEFTDEEEEEESEEPEELGESSSEESE